MTRSESKASLSWVKQTVCMEEPPSTSPASLVLLAKQYFLLDKSIYTEHRMKRVRNRWMKLQLKINKDEAGGLTCAICGRRGLNPWDKNKDLMATLDHRISLVNGGPWNDPANFQVACARCNNHKERHENRQTLLDAKQVYSVSC